MEWKDAVRKAEDQLVAEKKLHPDAIKTDYWRGRGREIRDMVRARDSGLQKEAIEEEETLYKKLKAKYERR